MKYTVRSGETILTLAVLFYYNWDKWPLLYFSNEEIIGDDPMILSPGITLEVPVPLMNDEVHIVISGDTSISLSNKYYGIPYYYRLIEEANDWPAELTVGNSYKIPLLCSRIEYDAAADLRRELHVEFDR
jgi:nucleoid-associated protein YgaU